jgi:hypothetical protein
VGRESRKRQDCLALEKGADENRQVTVLRNKTGDIHVPL